MEGLDPLRPGEGGDSSSDFQYAMEASRRETETSDGGLEERPSGSVDLAVARDRSGRHRRVELSLASAEPRGLRLSRLSDPQARVREPLTRRRSEHLLGAESPHGNFEIDPIQERSRKPSLIALDRARGAGAGTSRSPSKPAGTGVNRRDESETRGERSDAAHPPDPHPAVLHGLSQRFERGSGKLRKLVEEEDSVMREANLPRQVPDAASYHGGGRDRVVGRSKRRPRQKAALVEKTGDGIDLRDLERLLEIEPRKERRKPHGEKALSRARRTHHEEVVPARGRDLESPLRLSLSLHVREIEDVLPPRPLRVVRPVRTADGERRLPLPIQQVDRVTQG